MDENFILNIHKQGHEQVANTAEASSSAVMPSSDATDFNKGTWYQSNVSGMWYTEPEPAGDVAQIRFDGVYYIPFKSLRDKGL